MTRDELIERLSAEVKLLEGMSRTNYANGGLDAYRDALRMLEQLDSPPAMTWQDEPIAEGWYWAQFVPWFPLHWTGGVWVSSDEVDFHKLGRVCLIPEAPEWPPGGNS